MMSRKHLIALLACLLCLLPGLLTAQSLSRYEYWFDDDLAGITRVSLSGTSAAINADIPTNHLSPGIHRLNLRVRQKNAEYDYSPVTTMLFVKLNHGTSNTLEYWFDDRMDMGNQLPLTAFDEDSELVLDLRSPSKFPYGFHKLNMRVTTDGGGVSTVYTADVLKLWAGKPTKLEYWFDNDLKDKQQLDGMAKTGGWVYDTDIDLSRLSVGMHKLNYRAVSNSGVTNSSVASINVLKVPAGNTTMLEYWFDDDMKGRTKLTGQAAKGGYDFNFDLAMKNISPGAHRLYTRGISSDGRVATAVTMTPVVLKSRYDLTPQGATITSYSISVDDQEPIVIPVMSPRQEMVVPHTVNAAKMKDGKHQVKMTFTNSLNLSTSAHSNFQVKAQPEPTLTLTATEAGGEVRLKCNSVPNDQGIRFIRVDKNGAKRSVYRDNAIYPAALTFCDTPDNGTYTYYAECAYTKADGTKGRLTSNEVTVGVTRKAQTEYGYIIGDIRYDNRQKTSMEATVLFSDNGESVKVSNDGVFKREKIPVGTQLTMTLNGSPDYKASPVSITVRKGKNLVSFNAERNFDYVEDVVSYDLMFADNVQYEPGQYLKVKVTPCHHGDAWRGKLRLRVIQKDYDFLNPEGPQSAIDLLARNTYDANHNFFAIDSEEFAVSTSNPYWVTFSLKDMPGVREDAYFDFHVLSLGKTGAARWVRANVGFDNTKSIPLVYLLAGGNGLSTSENEKVQFVVNNILYMCGKIEGLNGYLGGIKDFVETSVKKYYDLKSLYEMLTTSTTLEEMMKKRELKEINEAVSRTIGASSQVVKSLQDELATKLRDINLESSAAAYLKDAASCLKALEEYKKIGATEQYYWCAEKIIDFAGGPISPLLKSYLDVTKAAINSIKNLGWAADVNNLPGYFFDKEVKIQIDMINSKGDHEHVGGLIDHIVVSGWNLDKESIATAHYYTWKSTDTYLFGIIGKKNPLFLQEDWDGGDPRGNNYHKVDIRPFQELWAEIYWRNGRVTRVALTPRCVGVSYNSDTKTFKITFKSKASDYNNLADCIELTPED